MLFNKRNLGKMEKEEREYTVSTTAYGNMYFSKSVPKYEMSEDGVSSKAAYQDFT